MPIYHGSDLITKLYHGSTAIGRVYHGSTLVYDSAAGGIPAPAVFSVTGGWTWFNSPRAIGVGDGVVIGAITGAGDLLVYDMQSTSGTDLRGSTFQVDDHANCALLRRSSDNKILAAATPHNGSGLYTYLSSNADDVSAFGAETNLDSSLGLSLYSYANLVQLTGETNDPIYLFFRADNGASVRQFYYSKSTDQGATWAAATKLLSNNGDSADYPPYVKMVRNGTDRIDFFCTDGHPDNTTTNSIYHFYYEGGSFKKTDGTTLTLPITPSSNLSKVYDGSTTRGWIWDCAVDGSGNPVCVYATYPGTLNHRYFRAKWNGTSWDNQFICGGGGYLYSSQPRYSGGVTMDPDDINVVFCSRGYAGEGNHRIWRYETADGGSSWTPTTVTTSGHSIRPFVVRDQAAEPRLAYMTGTYTSFTSFSTDIDLVDSGAGGAATVDPYWADVVLQIQPSGANGSTSFTDQSYSRHAITALGNAQVNSSELLLDGTGDCLTIPDDAQWRLAQGCGVEVKIKFAATTGTQTIISQYYTFGSQRCFMLRYNAGTLQVLFSSNGTTDTTVINYSWTPTANQQYHIGFEWASNTVYLLIDGSVVTSAAYSTTVFDSTALLVIGARQSTTSPTFQDFVNGRIAMVRFTNGGRLGNASPSLRYAPGPSYTAPTLPLPTA
jgi:hypothetical protein